MKVTLSTPVTTTLDGPVVVFSGIEGLTTLVFEDTYIDEVKFSDTTSAVGMFDNNTFTCGGDTPSTDMVEVAV